MAARRDGACRGRGVVGLGATQLRRYCIP
uniref:Uncharacterized protein n=1 Tax=Arundo donax TaxID=35708 RepID=A0A0A9C0Q7_ARUDO